MFWLHSSDYRRPADGPDGDVVVLGGGNSAAQLAVELSDTHRVTVISPRTLWFLPATVLGVDLYWWLYLTGTLNARAASPVSRYVRRRGDAIIGTDLKRNISQGWVRLATGRVTGADGRQLMLSDGSSVPAGSVLCFAGYRPARTWLRVPGALDADGEPGHRQGASLVPGLHWVGLPWQTRLNSSIINGVDGDAHGTAHRIQIRGRRGCACVTRAGPTRKDLGSLELSHDADVPAGRPSVDAVTRTESRPPWVSAAIDGHPQARPDLFAAATRVGSASRNSPHGTSGICQRSMVGHIVDATTDRAFLPGPGRLLGLTSGRCLRERVAHAQVATGVGDRATGLHTNASGHCPGQQ